MSIIKGIRDFILTFPDLSKFALLNVDYLSGNPAEYTIDHVPSEIIIEEDITGDSTRQFLFVFASRESYGQDALKNMANSGFYEKFESWLSEQNNKKNFPKLGNNQTPTEIEALGLGYLFENDDNTARYQIQCRLIYEQKGA